jgi:adhesin transport system membrane fusion protein
LDFCLIFVPFGHYDEPEILPNENSSNRPNGADVRHEQANHAIAEFRQRLQLASATHRDQMHDRLEKVRTELVQSEEIISKLEHRVQRLEILSPVRGIIKGLVVNTISGVIQPGEPLMYIVPYDEALVVEARIPPQYIGRIHTGQAVQVSISSYDFARYGVLEGTLERVSATTFRDSRDGRYYKGRIRLSRNYVGAESENNRILPGMTVIANIITGEKTVMDYMLKPIRTAVQTALSEH